ncbi:hypothetical protein, partial [Phocaeicola sartorii]|uniref:hypothetical protein n=3 Tax=Phocaeicola sartorii TaxID=671267 RepID=UPI002605C8A8
KDRHLFGERPHPFPEGQGVRAGKERTYHYISGEFRTHPDDSHKTPQQSFAKLLPLPPPSPLKPRWTGRFKGWWHHLFLYRKKGCCHHFHLFSTPERPMEGKKQEAEEDQTTGKGDGYGQTELRLHTDKNTVAISQNHSNNSVELWLHLDGTEVTAGRNCSFNRMELKFQPDGTG